MAARAGSGQRAVVATEPGDLVVIALGLPGPEQIVPGIADAFWLDPVVHVFQAIGVQQPGAPAGAQLAVPNVATFRGVRLTWQAACFGPATGAQATNPVAALVL